MLESPSSCQQKEQKKRMVFHKYIIKFLLGFGTGRQLFLTDRTNYCLGKVNFHHNYGYAIYN